MSAFKRNSIGLDAGISLSRTRYGIRHDGINTPSAYCGVVYFVRVKINLTEQKIAFLSYFPLGSGRLLQEPELIKISKELNLTSSQIALSWITTKWPTAIPIPRTKSKEHLLENIKAADIKLEKEIIEKLDGLF